MSDNCQLVEKCRGLVAQGFSPWYFCYCHGTKQGHRLNYEPNYKESNPPRSWEQAQRWLESVNNEPWIKK